jgi:hypothetical protein
MINYTVGFEKRGPEKGSSFKFTQEELTQRHNGTEIVDKERG